MIGQRLSHYRIVEQIGAGGMGVVYRAHDEDLDRDVAIKVLPAGALADEDKRKRFRKEAQSLARLNHPNVATVHEFGSENGLDFLVTEYIPGTTLDVKLARGALPTGEIVRLGLQMAAGLAAAHQQGIVHRDLKPANLRLTADGRLKILDFGLAQFIARASELGLTVTMTQSKDTSGTLPYMSPEQLRGEMPDPRSDIWAAGAVLYEMATGKRPFPQSNSALLVDAILNRVPDPPHKINANVPPPLERVIMKALARDPARRQQSAGELASDLSRSKTGAARRNWNPVVFAAATLLLAAATGSYFLLHRHASTRAVQVTRRPSVAVLGFKNVSGNAEKSWLSTALSEMLTTELGEGEQLRTIPGESVALMRASLSLPETDSFSQQTLSRIRQNLGADNIVIGSYVPLSDGMLRLDVRLQNTALGETLISVSEKGNETEIDDLVSKAGAELRAKLGVDALSDAQTAMVRASLPSNPEAARLYSLGLRKLRLFDTVEARDLLAKATALAPEHAPTHSALAEAWSALGYQAKAKEEAKLAFKLSSNFSQEERSLIEGRTHELMGEAPQAIASYSELWNRFPDQADYGLLLIRAQIAAGRGSEAEGTLESLRKLPLSDAEIARTDLAEGQLAISQSDFKRAREAAERAVNQGKAAGANLLVAEALRIESDAYERMGQSDKSVQLLTEAEALYAAAGYRQGAARNLMMSGDVLFDQGNLIAAKQKYDDALVVFREIGDQRRIRSTLERIGNVFYSQGKLHEAENFYNQALRLDHEFNDPFGLASDYGNIANVLDGIGDLKGALKMQQQALDAFNQTGDRRGASATWNNLGNLYVEMGNLEDAKKNFDQALALAREISFRRGEPYPIAGLGDVLQARGRITEAKAQYEQALALCLEMKDEDFAAQIRISLAQIALHEKRFVDGAALARQAAEYFEKTNSPGSAAWAQSVLARNLLAMGKPEEARAHAEKSVSLAQQTAGEGPRYEAALADARVKAKAGNSVEARRDLQAKLISTRKFGYRLYEYQIRFALAEIAQWSGAPATAELRTLEKDSTADGALLIATQARALLAEK